MISGSCREKKQQQQRSLLSFVEILRKQQGWVVGAAEVCPPSREQTGSSLPEQRREEERCQGCHVQRDVVKHRLPETQSPGPQRVQDVAEKQPRVLHSNSSCHPAVFG